MKKFINSISDYYLIFCSYALIGWLYEVFWMWFVVPPYHFVNRGVLLGPFLPIYGFGMLILLFMLDKFMKKKHKVTETLYLLISSIVVVTFVYTTIIEYATPKIYHVSDYLSQYGVGLIITNLIVFGSVYFLINRKKSKKLRNLDTTVILVFLLIWIITTVIEYVSHFVMDKCFHIMLWNYSKDFLNINARVNWDASRNFAIGGTLLLYTVQPQINKVLKKISRSNKIAISLIIGIPMVLDFIFHVIFKVI